MKKQKLTGKAGLVLRALCIVFGLLLTQATATFAQTYVQLTFNYDYHNSHTSGGDVFDYYTISVDFYQDFECTIPAADPNVDLNFSYKGRTNCGAYDTMDFTGSAANIAAGAYGVPSHLGIFNWSTYQTDHSNTWLELRPGTGYEIGIGNYIGGPGECY